MNQEKIQVNFMKNAKSLVIDLVITVVVCYVKNKKCSNSNSFFFINN